MLDEFSLQCTGQALLSTHLDLLDVLSNSWVVNGTFGGEQSFPPLGDGHMDDFTPWLGGGECQGGAGSGQEAGDKGDGELHDASL